MTGAPFDDRVAARSIERRAETEGGLVLDAVSAGYATPSGEHTAAVADVRLSVGRGEFVTLIGPSGCGKTTLLRVVAGLTEPDEGTVSIFGESVERARRNKHIGLVPQALALLPWRTVIENVRLGLEVNKKAAKTASPPRDPAEILDAFGLGAVLDKRPAELSGGMRQRVAIARAFALQPAVLLMDEPFSSLDELTSEVLRHELLELWHSTETTVLFVTHSVTEAVLLSDRVAVMSSGPGTIHAVVPIDIGRPRGELIELTEAFRDAEYRVRLELRAASGRAGIR